MPTGTRHQMAGLLRAGDQLSPQRKLHLGYRQPARAATAPFSGRWTGHEFHYATTLKAEGTPLFAAPDAEGTRPAADGLDRGPRLRQSSPI